MVISGQKHHKDAFNIFTPIEVFDFFTFCTPSYDPKLPFFSADHVFDEVLDDIILPFILFNMQIMLLIGVPVNSSNDLQRNRNPSGKFTHYTKF